MGTNSSIIGSRFVALPAIVFQAFSPLISEYQARPDYTGTELDVLHLALRFLVAMELTGFAMF